MIISGTKLMDDYPVVGVSWQQAKHFVIGEHLNKNSPGYKNLEKWFSLP